MYTIEYSMTERVNLALLRHQLIKDGLTNWRFVSQKGMTLGWLLPA